MKDLERLRKGKETRQNIEVERSKDGWHGPISYVKDLSTILPGALWNPHQLWMDWAVVRDNAGSGGVEPVSLVDFERELDENPAEVHCALSDETPRD